MHFRHHEPQNSVSGWVRIYYIWYTAFPSYTSTMPPLMRVERAFPLRRPLSWVHGFVRFLARRLVAGGGLGLSPTWGSTWGSNSAQLALLVVDERVSLYVICVYNILTCVCFQRLNWKLPKGQHLYTVDTHIVSWHYHYISACLIFSGHILSH